MNKLHTIAISALLSCLFYSCATSRSSSTEEKKKRTKITTIKPGIKNPTGSVINASGDGLSQGINQPKGAGSRENATHIASNAIERANELAKSKQQKLDGLTSTELINGMMAAQQTEISVSSNTRKTTANDKIRDYASMIVSSHATLTDELKNLSTQKNIALREEVSLKKASKTDLEFVKMMIESNRNLISLYTAMSHSEDPELKAFALKQLPALKKHLEAAQELTKEVKPN